MNKKDLNEFQVISEFKYREPDQGVLNCFFFLGNITLKREENIKNKISIIKLTFLPRDPFDNAYVVEEEIYRIIMSGLRRKKVTPHIVKYLGTLRKAPDLLSKLNIREELINVEFYKKKPSSTFISILVWN